MFSIPPTLMGFSFQFRGFGVQLQGAGFQLRDPGFHFKGSSFVGPAAEQVFNSRY